MESTVNQVVSKRMVRQQQMRWTPRGAHLLLQVRMRVLNEELRDTFSRWYHGMTSESRALQEAARAPGLKCSRSTLTGRTPHEHAIVMGGQSVNDSRDC